MIDRAIFRVQAADGRGPYRPGFSRLWADPHRCAPPTYMREFGTAFLREAPAGWHLGCGFACLQQLCAWFGPAERARLALLGFGVVILFGCRVLRQSQHQLVFARPTPLRAPDGLMPWTSLAGMEVARG